MPADVTQPELPADLRAAVDALPEPRRAAVLARLDGHPERWAVSPKQPDPPRSNLRRPATATADTGPAAVAVKRDLPCVSLGSVESFCPYRDPSKHVHKCNDTLSPYLTCRQGVEMQSCGCYRPVDDPTAVARVRHLLYYIYPVHGNGIWQRNLDELFRREELFDGTRTIAIARGPAGTVHPRPETTRPPHSVDPASAVRDYLGDFATAVIEIDNNPNRGETAAFQPLWESVRRFTGPADVTFYGHAKGVTRTVDPSVSVHPWTALLYAANLDYWPLVEKSLTKHPVTGALRYAGVWPPGSVHSMAAKFHYSGSFFWFRNRDVFSRNWKRIQKSYGGVERWPGICFGRHESGCVFGDNLQELPLPYDFPRLRQLMAEFREWSAANAGHRRPGASTEPWMDFCGYG